MGHEWQVGDRITSDLEDWDVRKVLKGGMGVVYILYQPERKALYAAKTYLDDRDPVLEQLFLRECKAWIGIPPHDNVVEAAFVRRIGGRPFLFLEFVNGGDLTRWVGTPELLGDRPLLILLATQFCDGMTHALAHSIKAHRDIKPANCLVTEWRTLKVSDFGLASIHSPENTGEALPKPEVAEASHQAHAADPPSDANAAADGPTRRLSPSELRRGLDERNAWSGRRGHYEMPTGTAAGTAPYMAPEQFADVKRVDVRADVYSFGAMFFQMVTGRLPFVAADFSGFRSLHQTAAPPRLTGDRRLDYIVQTCLAKQPDDRFPDFKEIRDLLVMEYRTLTGEDPPPPRTGEALDNYRLLGNAMSFAALGMMADADECYARFQEREPDFMAQNPYMKPGGMSPQGLVFNITAEGERDALGAHAAVLAERPDDRDALLGSGIALFYLDRLDEAMTFLNRALVVDGTWAPTWFNKGLVLSKSGAVADALKCFDAANGFVRLTDQHPALQDDLELKILTEKARAEFHLGQFDTALRTAEMLAGKAPDSIGAWTMVAVVSSRLRQSARALEAADRALDLKADHVDALIVKRDTLIGLHQFEAARVVADRIERLGHAQDAEALTMLRAQAVQEQHGVASYEALGEIADLVRAGSLVEAVTRCEAALADAPGFAMLWFLKGDSELKLGDYEAALASLTRASQLEPQERSIVPLIWRCQGDALLTLEREQEAVVAYQASLAEDDSQALAWQNLGVALLILGEGVEAGRAFEAAARLGNPDAPRLLSLDLSTFSGAPIADATLWRYRGRVNMLLGSYDLAIRQLTTAIALNPRDAEAYYYRAGMRQAKRALADAIADYTAALEITPDNPDYYGDRASARMQTGDWTGMIADCNVAIALRPRDYVAYHNRGVARLQLRQFDDALVDFTTAIEIRPQEPDGYRNRGYAYMEQGSLERAIEDFTQTITLSPRYPQAYANRGRAYRLAGRPEAAIDDLTTAITLDRRLVDPHVDRAAALMQIGNLAGAIDDCKAALARDPNCREAHRLMQIAAGRH